MGFDATAREWARQALAFLKDLGPPSQGDLIYRGASGWDRLAAGTAGYALTTGGAGADPAWTPFASGTYTPTLTNTTNIDASVAHVTAYQRVGNTFGIGGRVQIDPTAAGSIVLGVSLPIASNFGAIGDCGGNFSSGSGSIVGAISADNANDRLTFTGNATVTTNVNCYFTVFGTII